MSQTLPPFLTARNNVPTRPASADSAPVQTTLADAETIDGLTPEQSEPATMATADAANVQPTTAASTPSVVAPSVMAPSVVAPSVMASSVMAPPPAGNDPLETLPGMPAEGRAAAVPNPRDDIAALDELERHLFAHRYARTGIECFSGTIDPPAALEDTGEVLAVFEAEDQALLCSPATGALLERLSTPEAQALMDDTHKAQVRILSRDRASLVDVPVEEQEALARLTSESQAVWRRAKKGNDWASFAPYLDRIVDALRRIAGYRCPGADAYNVWLNEHEHGCDQAFYDSFFAQVKDTVVPLLADVTASAHKPTIVSLEGRFDARRQWELAADLLDLEGLPREALFVTAAEHPFSGSLTPRYAIIAGHVHEDDVLSNVYSMLHEGGHALYETGVDPMLTRTSLVGGTSAGMHEAQSRFFENYIGRDEAFTGPLLAALRRHFPSTFNRITTRQLYLAINNVQAQPIRTEADELTYPLHVLVRYEIEQLLMSGEASAADVPRLWSERYRRYLGIRIPDDAHGALQDMHWSSGSLGYFPTYALGSAYGAQLRHAMIAEGMDWQGVLTSGNLEPIRDWLGVSIWCEGRMKDAADLIYDACGEAFDTSYYTTYLQEKFSAIYGL